MTRGHALSPGSGNVLLVSPALRKTQTNVDQLLSAAVSTTYFTAHSQHHGGPGGHTIKSTLEENRHGAPQSHTQGNTVRMPSPC